MAKQPSVIPTSTDVDPNAPIKDAAALAAEEARERQIEEAGSAPARDPDEGRPWVLTMTLARGSHKVEVMGAITAADSTTIANQANTLSAQLQRRVYTEGWPGAPALRRGGSGFDPETDIPLDHSALNRG